VVVRFQEPGVPAESESIPKIPHGFHAFLLADIHVHDPGIGTHVDVLFCDGTCMRARASAEVLRLGDGMQGKHRATLHFRTDHDGQLISPLHLYRLRSIKYPLPGGKGSFWSALGIRGDAEKSLRIYPEKANSKPFQIAYRSENDFQSKNGEALRVSGHLESGLLVAGEILRAQSCQIPDRWFRWRWN
jgi:hypothetical protein